MKRKIISGFILGSLLPLALAILFIKSEVNRFRGWMKPQKLLWQKDYSNGQQILLFAAYQYGALRRDTIKLLQAARKQGLYVLVVNTGKIKTIKEHDDLIDCYIERQNHGRDFGSYKAGFQHIFENAWEKNCPRLLLMNDSVFVSETTIDAFVKDMMTSEIEVLGSTENYEVEHHLGSFCIAMAGSILNKERFKKFWNRYRNSDMRPTVIRRGEMGLSKALKRCASSSSSTHFKALYDSTRFLTACQHEDGFMDHALVNARTCDIISHWPRYSPNTIAGDYSAARLMPIIDTNVADLDIAFDEKDPIESVSLTSMEDAINHLKRITRSSDSFDPADFKEFAIGQMVYVFMQGSQIHQNQAALLQMGLPIVKIDGLYRGMFNIEDILRVSNHLTPEDVRHAHPLLLARSYGGTTHMGWKRTAFIRGLI